MKNKELELWVAKFKIGAIKNNVKNAIIYFVNEKTGIIKRQVFVNGTAETRFLLSSLGLDGTKEWKDYYDILYTKSIDLVLEKKIEGRIVALANSQGEFTIIENEYFDNGESFLPDGNISYFEKTYDVDSERLSILVSGAVEKKKVARKIRNR